MASDLAPEWLDELERLERECRESWDAVSTDRYRLRCDLSVELLTHAQDLIEAARERDRLREALAEARMARRCFDIMARRCWFIDRVGEKWAVGFNWSDYAAIPKLFAAHGTIAEAMALMIEADEWLAKQETEGNSDEC